MSMLSCILWAIFLVIILQCNAFRHGTKTDDKNSSLLSDDSDKSDHLRDKLERDKNFRGDYHVRDEKKNLNGGSGDSYMPPIGIGEFEDIETTSEYDDTTSDYDDESDQDSVCILAQSQFYLSWWVHENGSLRIPSNVRLNTSGIMDLSIYFSSEEMIFNHVLSFTSNNPEDVSTCFCL